MRTKLFSTLCFLAISIFTFFSTQITGGFIIIEPPFPMPQRPAPLKIKNHDIQVSIDKQIATTKVTQVFHNPNNYELEGKYIFPVPQNASISNFTILVNKKKLHAKILDKNKARQIYETIIRRRKDPALLEYVGRDMIQARVYPIAAHSNMSISFEYTEVLKANNGSVQYRHSLGADKYSNKRVSNVSITVKINSEKNIVNIYSPTHELSTHKDDKRKAKVHCTEKNVNSSHDFILYYTVPQNEIGFNVLTYKENKKDGFFLAMMSPNMNATRQQIVAKNIVFVVDRSGSMGTKKMQQAKDALKFCLENLNEQDHFNIIAFDDRLELYNNKLVRANYTQIQQASAFVDTIHSRAWTNIDEALEKALYMLPNNSNPNMIIFLTDGRPTAGECNITRIIENTQKRNRNNTKVFSFGVGYNVNTTLLDKIALDNKGTSDYVRPCENIETVVTHFYKKIANPVLTDLFLQSTGTNIKEIFPINLPDLFHSSQLLIMGRYTKGGNVTLNLSGKKNKTEKEYIFTTKFAKNDTSNNFLPRLWATRKIAFLIDNIILEGESKEIVEEIIRLSKKYGIITEHTSFLIDTDNDDFDTLFDDENGCVKFLDSTCYSLSCASQDQVGKSAVMRAKNQENLRNCSHISTSYTIGKNSSSKKEKMRTIGSRTFYLKDNIWIDAEHTNSSQITKVKLFSNTYFELLKTNPNISIYLSLGKNIIIKTNTGSIQVYDS